jgi:DNA repair protein RecN (Recombination protein N)
MLRTLGIRDFVIVDRLDLEFEAGFTVLTGETGAGKSILIDALSLVLGERSDAELVRDGCARAEISAEFDIRALPDLARWLEASDLAGEPGMCLLRRVLEANGRSRAYLNGRPTTLTQVKELGERLVDIHGQHEHQSLVRSGAQRDLLDAFGDSAALSRDVEQAWRRWQELTRRRMQSESNAEALAAERERLQWQVQELTQLAFSAAEWGDLQADHRRLAHAASLIETVESGLEALSEGEAAALTTLNSVVSRLHSAQHFDTDLKDILDMLEPAQIQIQEAAYSLRHYRQRLDVDPARLREVEQRLDAVHSAARKYRCNPEELPQLLAQAERRLEELGGTAGAQTLVKGSARPARPIFRWRAN